MIVPVKGNGNVIHIPTDIAKLVALIQNAVSLFLNISVSLLHFRHFYDTEILILSKDDRSLVSGKDECLQKYRSDVFCRQGLLWNFNSLKGVYSPEASLSFFSIKKFRNRHHTFI